MKSDIAKSWKTSATQTQKKFDFYEEDNKLDNDGLSDMQQVARVLAATIILENFKKRRLRMKTHERAVKKEQQKLQLQRKFIE